MVGAVNVDLVVAAPRLPAPGETVVGAGLTTFGGGKGANAAVAAARMGAEVRLIGAVGGDDHGRRALDELRDDGVDVEAVAVLYGHPTGVALIVVDAGGENQIALGPGANHALTADGVRARLTPLLASAGCVLVSTEIPGEVAVAAVRATVAAGVPCLLNPAPVIPAVTLALDSVARLGTGGWSRGTTAEQIGSLIVTPNATELAQLAAMGLADQTPDLGEPADHQVPDHQVLDHQVPGSRTAVGSSLRALASRTGSPAVVTLGADGALVAWPDGRLETFAAPVVEVRDTTGAGDTFNGVLAAHLASGVELDAAVARAVAAASLSVIAQGARSAMPTSAALDAAPFPGPA